ncbi:siderophore synthetase component [Kineococcus xinjiangensis]|uniref:Siderophore synthetase component n=1 Tax=Kineococcus xinjiangensis TaxID=512762 RepID=A0A2S6IDT0_9ACTN|nr:IucA/IucC family protein [Kineococcus xinjiangensis]PPK92333.1 siderophore synthetase component [Kineococcus xinjiangensis]
MTLVAAPGRAAGNGAGARARTEALHVLLRCWLRETGVDVPDRGTVRLDLPATGRLLDVEVLRRSPSGAHALGECRVAGAGGLDLAEVAALLSAEAAARAGLPPVRAEDARARIVESATRAAGYAEARASDPEPPAGLPAWLAAEQDLLAGHPWHPMTKSRDGLPDAEDARYSPESRGRFPLHWFAVAPSVLATGSTGLDVPGLLHGLAAGVRAPEGFVPVPAHPWQAARLAERPAAADLLHRGDLVDLGPAGPEWWATSSLRTVARPGADVMLKLSLRLRVTNSRRENVRGELLLGQRTAALVEAGLGAALAAAHPGFGLVLDPAWVGVDSPAGPVGLDTVVRQQPFAPTDRIACAGALVDARPDRGAPVAADLVRALAARRAVPVAEAAAHWYRRWLDAVARPLLWLHGAWGVGLEAHLQNTLVGLDAEGVPDRAWYRDNQGWYVAASHAARADVLLPGAGEGVPLVFDDTLVTDRVVYYLGVNGLLSVAAALAGAGLAAEEDLLAVLVGVLRECARGSGASPAAALLLEADALPVKANLLTGVGGRDELEGPVESQSVYVAVPNPLKEVRP